MTDPTDWPLPALQLPPQFRLKLRAIGFCGVDGD